MIEWIRSTTKFYGTGKLYEYPDIPVDEPEPEP